MGPERIAHGPGTIDDPSLTAELAAPELPAYGRLLLDVFNRDPTLSIRADEAEESWRVVTPVLDAWAKELVPLQEYAAGSDGPPDALVQPAGADDDGS